MLVSRAVCVVFVARCKDLTAESPLVAAAFADDAKAELSPSHHMDVASPAADAWSKHDVFAIFA